MTEVFIRYNPYKVETTILYDNEEINQDSQLAKYKNERLQVWLDQLIDILIDELNESEFKLLFQGTLPDYDDVSEECLKYNQSKRAKIQLVHIPAEGKEDKISELTQLVDEMQRGPFEELRSDGIRKNFEKALSSDFEIAVIATMSSGKSTLINSLLGKELMPSKHAACTATIASIRNVPGRDEFTGRCYDKEGLEIEPLQPLDGERMKEFNKNEEVSHIEIEGSIPYISSKRMNLILVDTPGPNNSRNSAHKDHTYRVLKNESKPVVLYVLNSTQLSTDDDNNLLSIVAEQMKSGGKQSKDRFIFAVNKIDLFDPEEETIDDTLKDVRDYLQDKGINNPNIFPVSAEIAKVIRMHQNGEGLTPRKIQTLEAHKYFIKEPQLHLVKYAPLSYSKKQSLVNNIEKARRENDSYAEALIHSGIPAIEEAINEYLDKYAVTAKITAAVNSFKDVVEGKKMEQKLQNEMSDNEELRKNINLQMKRIQEEISKGQKASAFKERINRKKYDVRSVMRRVEGKVHTKIDDFAAVFNNEGSIEESKAKKIIAKLKEDISSLQSDIKTDLELIILATMQNDAEQLLDEYRSYVKDLIEISGNGIKKDEFQIFAADLPAAESLVDNLKYSKKVADGEKWVKTSSWWNPFSWGDGYYETTYTTKTFVDVNKIAEEVINPTKKDLLDNVNKAQKFLDNEVLKLKTFFNAEIDRLENLLLLKVNEIEKLSGDNEILSSKINEDLEKRKWLQDFVIRLDRIIEI
ncbi:GTPase SAR1 family protein [Paenibacillus endophyticus]|uniref:GTPase SAR1 family protein n=1 Tax=Paenibacillus endophyticus TaxID=1294268 RepID=A0A7W5CC74_9BACL|nr:dynamin family protein [Paenibacillus endophyticus]MBB3155038.1 GTPase SAR1 family protein [Paenibacillus endophyticus]